MRGNRRLLVPIGMVVGFLVCAYTAFFAGVKQDWPSPPGAEQKPISVSQQTSIVSQWPQIQNWQTAGSNFYIVREKPEAAVAFYTKAFHNLGWADAPNPGLPKDAGSAKFSVLSFTRNKQQVILAFSTGQDLDNITGDFGTTLKKLYGSEDNLAILVSGTLK